MSIEREYRSECFDGHRSEVLGFFLTACIPTRRATRSLRAWPNKRSSWRCGKGNNHSRWYQGLIHLRFRHDQVIELGIDESSLDVNGQIEIIDTVAYFFFA